MDRSMQAKKAALEQRISDLDERREALYEELETVKRQRAKTIEELKAAERAVKLATPTEGQELRAAVVRMKVFTLPELVAELGITRERAKRHLDVWLASEYVKQTGKSMGKALYEYQPPQEAGRAFERQQERRRQEEQELVEFVRAAGPVAGSGGGMISQVPDPEVRKAVKEAMADGWKLERAGGSHFRLTLGKRRVTVPSTPRNSGNAARVIRQHCARGGGRPRAGTAA